MHKHGISIWFFIGSLLSIYGALIMGSGIYNLFVKPEHNTVLSNLHAGIWWGAIMLALGLVYVTKFRPSKTEQPTPQPELTSTTH